jgi:hypothetical protein
MSNHAVLTLFVAVAILCFAIAECIIRLLEPRRRINSPRDKLSVIGSTLAWLIMFLVLLWLFH